MVTKAIGSIYRWLMIISVSGAIGAVVNIVLFFLATLLFAGAEGDAWARWYFGNEGVYFLGVTVLLALAAFPFVKQLRSRIV